VWRGKRDVFSSLPKPAATLAAAAPLAKKLLSKPPLHVTPLNT